jgi:glycosyltransferase involved in cell wall biosynthesis
MKWICCQIGAREHYAVPRALHLSGLLDELITDLWMRSGTFGRFHAELAQARVSAPNLGALLFELKSAHLSGWKLIKQRNEWFQRRALDHLEKQSTRETRTVFAYSYAAERIFRFARERGWKTVLGQIDPGPADEQVVAKLNEKFVAERNGWQPAPREYWENWRTECALADQIVVNSAWSRNALLSEGVPAEKINILPLAYERTNQESSFQRHYPNVFTSARPLRVLFLGQVNLRKGVGQLFESIALLAGEAVEFWFVGPVQISIPPRLSEHSHVKWFGVAPRAKAETYYQQADVFIFPTLSDGFGLTQLEAQSWKLPVVASRHCGEVVSDGVNGVVLEEVSGQAIAEVLRKFLRAPETLRAMSERSGVSDRFSLGTLASSLCNL